MESNFENIVLGKRYELIEKIGSGGMAFVYKARDIRLGRNVAVKILKTEFTNNKDFIQKFSLEAMSAASITHPNIVSIYDAGYDNGIFYIVMELIEGITLRDLIEKKKYLKWKDALMVTKQILAAMEVAHKNNIIHRDIKPHNIMLTFEGVAKVADFGIAKVVSETTKEISDLNIGSVHYISPEQAKGNAFDERADLYSIGITLFEMLIGKVPFDGETAVAVAMKNIQEPLTPPHTLNPAIPVGVSDFVVKATMKDPEDRFQSAVDMLSSLQVVLLIPNEHLNYASDPQKRGGKPASGSPRTKPSGNSERNRQKARSRMSLKTFLHKNYREVIIAAVALLLAVVVFSLSFSGISGNMAKYRTVEYTMVDFVGKQYNDVAEMLSKKGVAVKLELRANESVPAGVILRQSLEPGAIVKTGNAENNAVTFEVSNGYERYVVNDFRGQELRILRNAFGSDIHNIVIIDMVSNEVESEHIIATRPGAGEIISKGETIYVYMSKGPAAFSAKTVGNYDGMTEGAAKKAIKEAGYEAVVKKLSSGSNGAEMPEDPENPIDPTPTPTPPAKKVTAQYPAQGTALKAGEKVVIYLDDPVHFREMKKGLLVPFRDSLGASFRLEILITYGDTQQKETLYDVTWNKEDGDFVFDTLVSFTGETRIEVNVDNQPYCTFLLQGE